MPELTGKLGLNNNRNERGLHGKRYLTRGKTTECRKYVLEGQELVRYFFRFRKWSDEGNRAVTDWSSQMKEQVGRFLGRGGGKVEVKGRGDKKTFLL